MRNEERDVLGGCVIREGKRGGEERERKREEEELKYERRREIQRGGLARSGRGDGFTLQEKKAATPAARRLNIIKLYN